MSFFRVGEALHPGPFQLSVVNSTGLTRKAEFLTEYVPGIIAASETQLSSQGIPRFASELHCECPGAKLNHGEPAPKLSNTVGSSGGAHTGVAFITTYPCRSVPGKFDVPDDHLNRVHAAHFWMGKQWITGGVIYGFAKHGESVAVREATNQLIEAVTQKVCCQPGPRFLAGDWNQEPGTLDVEKWLQSEGWLELQTVAAQRWGLIPQATCKGKTRKDYLYLCPLMQELLLRCQLDHHVFADHSVMTGHFRDLASPPLIPIWRHPAPLPWTHEQLSLFRSSNRGGDLESDPTKTAEGLATEQYQAIWHEYEEEVDAFHRRKGHPGLHDHHRGRASTLTRTWVRQRHHVLKPSREGEPQIQDCRPSHQVKHWFLQLRRLVNLSRATAPDNNPKSGRAMHIVCLWGACRRAKGFEPDFSTWWRTRPVQGPDAIDVIPESVPSHEDICQITEVVRENVEYLQQQRIQERLVITQARHAKDTNQVFKDVKGQMAAPVETLLDQFETTVVDAPEADTVIVSDGHNFQVDLPVYGIAGTNAKQYTHLRAQALKALKLQKSGANSMIFFALCCHPQHDPECYALAVSVRMARRHVHGDNIAPYMEQISITPERRRNPGPMSMLMSRLDSIGWSHVQASVWQTHLACVVDILEDPFQEVMALIHLGFQAHVGSQMSTRPGFGGLEQVDAIQTLRCIRQGSDKEVTMMQTLQIGSFMSGDQLGRAHQESSSQWTCKFCQQPDSLEHRWLHCSETQWSRDELQTETLSWVQLQPECTQLRGWLCVPVEVQQFQAELHTATPEVIWGGNNMLGDGTGKVYIFTDGAGRDPTCAASRLVAWAWCFANEIGEENYYFGASGSVPGRWQTVVRAELLAVIHAMEHCAAFHLHAVIFSDNLGIVGRARQCIQGQFQFDQCMGDGDLWERFQRVAATPGIQWSFVHVFSHQEPTNMTTLETWICHGNECADKLATQMLDQLPSSMIQLQCSAAAAHRKAIRCFSDWVKHLVRVGHQSIRAIDKVSSDLPVLPMQTPVDIQAVVAEAGRHLPETMTGDWVQSWLQWFSSIEDTSASPVWVSWLELLIHYQLVTQQLGVESVRVPGMATKRHWQQVRFPNTKSMKALSRAFSNFGRQLIRLAFKDFRATQGRPAFHRVYVWLFTVLVILLDPTLARLQRRGTAGPGVVVAPGASPLVRHGGTDNTIQGHSHYCSENRPT
eukprot:Skav217109  [mRNA]  locus=scaffold1627:183318:189509:- [translate_table: standard]